MTVPGGIGGILVDTEEMHKRALRGVSKYMRSVSLLTVFIAGAAFAQGGDADTKISLFINDRQVNAPVLLDGDSVFVPIRPVARQMGINVYLERTPRSERRDSGDRDVVLHSYDNNASVYGREVVLTNRVRQYSGETMVPLRFLSRFLGARCRWIDTENRVEIDTDNYSGIWSPGGIVPAGTELHAQLLTPIDSAFSHTGDPIVARITGATLGSKPATLYGHVAYDSVAYEAHPGLLGIAFDKYQADGGPVQRISGSIISGSPAKLPEGYNSSFVFLGLAGAARSPLMRFQGNFFADVVYDDQDPELTAWVDEKRPLPANASVPAGTELHILLNQVDEPAFEGPGM